MTERLARKIFPEYFNQFTLPDAAKEQEIEVYRACPTRKIERESFLNTYEEAGFRVSPGMRQDDPQVYCLSVSSTLKGVKRFVVIDSRYQPPYLLAKGHTTKQDGRSCMSNEWKTYRSQRDARKDPHVDWWLYVDAEPWTVFEEVEYESEERTLLERKR